MIVYFVDFANALTGFWQWLVQSFGLRITDSLYILIWCRRGNTAREQANSRRVGLHGFVLPFIFQLPSVAFAVRSQDIVWYIRHDLLHSATTHRFTPQHNINSDTRKMQPSGIDQASLGAGRNVLRGDVWGLSAKVLGWTRHLTCFRFRSWYIVVTQFPQSQPRLFALNFSASKYDQSNCVPSSNVTFVQTDFEWSPRWSEKRKQVVQRTVAFLTCFWFILFVLFWSIPWARNYVLHFTWWSWWRKWWRLLVVLSSAIASGGAASRGGLVCAGRGCWWYSCCW